ncbi:O-antigen polymerase [Leptospira stimsonii]|uniref:Oligosaccharide repeat unit polymerase n=1 Tax=Leptospira stimsonii TaxID=2202203 RepID=A0A396Z5T1_9LEPT|nr:O-antigen polymerase [Leptospira stimsonii]RHX90852.1 oligosaccharide repeat unit polymerase [Leptospira stimsonii]
MSLIIFAFGILNITLSYLLLKKTGLVLLLVQSYWFFWMFISSLSLTGLFIPSDFTYYLYIMLLSSLTIGAGLYRFSSSRIIFRRPLSRFRILLKQKERLFFLFLLFCIFPIVLFLFLKSVYLNLRPDALSPALFRSAAYGLNGESILFGKNKYLYYYSLLITPIVFASLFLGTAFYLRLKKVRVLSLSFALVAMETLMFLGRFGFYYILISLLFILFIKTFRDIRSVLRSFTFGRVFAILAIFTLIFFVGALRNKERKFDFNEFVNTYVIDYHTESFSIFDSELNSRESIIHERTYGRASIGGIESTVSFLMALIRIPYHFQIQADLIGGYLSKNRLLGYGADGRAKEYNAFGSVLFTLYKDGGIPFTVFMGILFGFCVAKFSRSFISLNPYQLSLLSSLLFIGIFGLFKPVLAEQVPQTILFLFIFWRL